MNNQETIGAGVQDAHLEQILLKPSEFPNVVKSLARTVPDMRLVRNELLSRVAQINELAEAHNKLVEQYEK